MLQDLLYCLSGYTGEVFVSRVTAVEDGDDLDGAYNFSLSRAIVPSLHPGECDSLNKLAAIGAQYAELRDFCQRSTYLSDPSPSNSSGAVLRGAYTQALATGINSELELYRAVVLSLEKSILAAEVYPREAMPLSEISAQLIHYPAIFATLLTITRRLNHAAKQNDELSYQFRGARILDILRMACNTGVPTVHEAMMRVYKKVGAVWWRMTIAWCVDGSVWDPWGEWIVCAPKAGEDSVTIATAAKSHQQHLQQVRATLNEANIPSHLSIDIATALVFIGDTVSSIAEMRRRSQYQVGHSTSSNSSTNNNSWMNVRNGYYSRLGDPLYSTESTAAQLPWADSLKQLAELNCLLDDPQCTAAIGAVNKQAAEYLWNITKMDTVIEQWIMQDVRGILLLGYGLWAERLLDEVTKLTRATRARSSSSRDNRIAPITNRAMRHLLNKTAPALSHHVSSTTSQQQLSQDDALMAAESLLRRFSLVKDTAHVSDGNEVTESDPITLRIGGTPVLLLPQPGLDVEFSASESPAVHTPWPLSLLISDNDTKHFISASAFLFNIARVRSRITSTLGLVRPNRYTHRHQQQQQPQPQQQQSSLQRGQSSSFYKLYLQTRWRMFTFVEALWVHFQTDVIDKAFDEFNQRVRHQHRGDVDAVRSDHARLAADIHVGLMLHPRLRGLRVAFGRALRRCELLCHMVSTRPEAFVSNGADNAAVAKSRNELEQIARDFNEQTEFLKRTISSLTSQQTVAAMQSWNILAMRLDF